MPGDLVTEVSTDRKVKVCRGLMKGGYSTSFDAGNDFVLILQILPQVLKRIKE